MHIADPLRQKNLCPFAISADHLHLGAVRQLGEGSVLYSRASADVQISAIGCDNPHLGAFRFFPGRIIWAFLSRFSTTEHNAVFCHRDFQRTSQKFLQGFFINVPFCGDNFISLNGSFGFRRFRAFRFHSIFCLCFGSKSCNRKCGHTQSRRQKCR